MIDTILIKRCENFINELGVRIDKFCDNAGIGKTTYYQWKKGNITISDRIKANIDQYLQKFGY